MGLITCLPHPRNDFSFGNDDILFFYMKRGGLMLQNPQVVTSLPLHRDQEWKDEKFEYYKQEAGIEFGHYFFLS